MLIFWIWKDLKCRKIFVTEQIVLHTYLSLILRFVTCVLHNCLVGLWKCFGWQWAWTTYNTVNPRNTSDTRILREISYNLQTSKTAILEWLNFHTSEFIQLVWAQNFVELLYYKIQWQGFSIANDAVVLIETEKHVNASIGTFGNWWSIYPKKKKILAVVELISFLIWVLSSALTKRPPKNYDCWGEKCHP